MIEFWEMIDRITEESKDANSPKTRLLMENGISFLEIQESIKSIRLKFCKMGLILPETEEELELWTEEFEDFDHDLPESLIDPMKILDRIKSEDNKRSYRSR